MSQQQYLIRLDDACPTMNHSKWKRMEGILERYGIKPLVGVIPHNEDQTQQIAPADEVFWDHVKAWMKKDWSIALHGYNHNYASNDGMKGLNPMWARSEFAGLPLEAQREKIRKGVAIMREHDINPKYFFAPSHTFDNVTLEALRLESDIRVISDTIGRYPYKNGVFWYIPQILGHCAKMPFTGIFTFCFHPNTMSDVAFEALENFLKTYRKQFVGFDDIDLQRYGSKKMVDKLLSWAFFTYRRLRGLH